MDRQPFWEVSNRRDYLDSCRFRYSVYLLYYWHSFYFALLRFGRCRTVAIIWILTDAGILFTWFTSTKRQILTREELGGRLEALKKEMPGASVC